MAQHLQRCVYRRKKMNEIFRPQTKSWPEGFTLLELLVSFVIIAVLLLGAAQLTLHSLMTKRISDCSMESAELASGKLEYLKSLLFESSELGGETILDRLEGRKVKAMFHQEWKIEDISVSLKKIEMVCYALSYPHKSTRMVLFCSGDLGF